MKDVKQMLMVVRPALCWWLGILLLYAVLLLIIKPNPLYYVGSSILYHLLLIAFPVFLILRRHEIPKNIGFTKGNVREGLFYVLLLPIMGLTAIFFITVIFKRELTVASVGSEVSIYVVVLYVLIAPVTEEVFHRGYLQTKFEQVNETGGLIMASLVFSIIHLPKILIAVEYISPTFIPILSCSFVPISGAASVLSLLTIVATFAVPILLLYFFIVGIVLGLVYRSTESVYYPIIAHTTLNTIILLVALR